MSTGTFQLSRYQGPAVLIVLVPALPEASIPKHTIHLMANDYDAALEAMSEEEREAWNEYIGKPRRSSLYCPHRRARYYRRSRSESGASHYFSLEPGYELTKPLEEAAQILLEHADRPTIERLELARAA